MPNNQEIIKYTKEHLLTQDLWTKYNLWGGPDFIEIPIKDENGKRLFSKYRVFGGKDKYRYEKGSSMALFNADKITAGVSNVTIVEGEFDAMVLHEFKNDSRDAVVSSTGGAGTWKEEWNKFLENKYVNILLDNDEAGMVGAFKVWEKISISNKYVAISLIETHKDICQLLYNDKENYYKHILGIFIGFSLYDFPKKTWKEKNAVFKQMFSDLDVMEMSVNTQQVITYITAFREFLSKIYHREKPIRKMKKIWSDSEITLEKIRSVPITNFIKFSHNGTAQCIFHTDSDPSMHYNPPNSKFPNTIKCFSCGKFCGVVDVVMQLNNIGFSEAVEILKKYL